MHGEKLVIKINKKPPRTNRNTIKMNSDENIIVLYDCAYIPVPVARWVFSGRSQHGL